MWKWLWSWVIGREFKNFKCRKSLGRIEQDVGNNMDIKGNSGEALDRKD